MNVYKFLAKKHQSLSLSFPLSLKSPPHFIAYNYRRFTQNNASNISKSSILSPQKIKELVQKLK